MHGLPAWASFSRMKPEIVRRRPTAKPSIAQAGVFTVRVVLLALVCFSLAANLPACAEATRFLNVKDFGATGIKTNDAQEAIQKAIDACGKDGGTVYLPPGEYTSGTLHLRSHVKIYVDLGATVFASEDPSAYAFQGDASKAALFTGTNLTDVGFDGLGTIDGQAEYVWREDDFETGFDHKTLMQRLGKSLQRSFPKGFPKREVFPHLLWLGYCTNVTATRVSFLHAPNWSLSLYACERARFDQLYINTSMKDGVWADGIDLDGCKDVEITNCKMETGDDCIALVSQNTWGPPLACENVTVRNCLLSSASAGVKFSEGNRLAIRNILIADTLFTNVNRGVVFNNTFGGTISHVVMSNLVFYCNRFDWFWAGDGQPFYFRVTRLSELTHEPAQPGELPPGLIRDVVIRDVEAHAKGSSCFHGHSENPMTDLTLEHVKFFMSTDTNAAFDLATNALDFRAVERVNLKDVSIAWQAPRLKSWESALAFHDAANIMAEGLKAEPGNDAPSIPTVMLDDVRHASFTHCIETGNSGVFLKAAGKKSDDIHLAASQLDKSKRPFLLEKNAPPGAVAYQP